MLYTRLYLSFLLLVASTVSQAASTPKGGDFDPRITEIVYNESDVVRVVVSNKSVFSVFFEEGEIYDIFGLGDPDSWLITPAKSRDKVFIEPVDGATSTNLTITTNKRVYFFDLVPVAHAPEETPIYSLRYIYEDSPIKEEEDAPDNLPKPLPHNARFGNSSLASNSSSSTYQIVDEEKENKNYSFAGAYDLKPSGVADNGQFTRFSFPSDTDLPSIFIVLPDGKEKLANFNVEGRDVVVHRVAAEFVIRKGLVATCIFNNAYDHSNRIDNNKRVPLSPTLKASKQSTRIYIKQSKNDHSSYEDSR